VSHAKEAESHGFLSRPTLVSEAMISNSFFIRRIMTNIGETHFPTEYLIKEESAD
jgi:hypothetical protein